MIDWGLVKLQYEIFGESVEDLAVQFDTSTRLIDYAIKNENWQRFPIATALSDWRNLDSIEELPPDLVDQVRDRMSILFTLKQSTLNPRYIAIETAILGKAQNIIQNLSPEHPNAAQVLKAIADVFTSLRDAAGMVGKQQEEEQKGVQVNIMTKVGDKQVLEKPPVAVQIKG